MVASLPYFDRLIGAFQAGHAGRDVHLGYWDTPPDAAAPCTPADFVTAQARLTQRVLDHVPAWSGSHVLDVACGLGGALAALNAAESSLVMTGVNIDNRQLAICRTIDPRRGNRINLIRADACRLPLRDTCCDVVICIEAMFHFTSRAHFLTEVARVLRPDGVLAVTDILLRDPGASAPWTAAGMLAAITADYGTWPAPWLTSHDLTRVADKARLTVTQDQDWTRQTLPSYRVIAPHPAPGRLIPVAPIGDRYARGVGGAAARGIKDIPGARPTFRESMSRAPGITRPDAGSVLRWLHHHGCLQYRMMCFRRR